MYNGKTVSLKRVLWTVMNNPLATDITYNLAAEYALEGIRLIGAPLSLVNKVTHPPLQIVSHKAALPEELVEIRGVRAMTDKDSAESEKFAMTYASDLYHANLECEDDTNCIDGLGLELTYTVDMGIIKTSFAEGFVEVAYKSLPVDDEGFPLLPDNQKVLLAIEYYILERYLFNIWTLGKITDKAYEAINQKKLWYMGAASSDMQIQSYDHVEAIMNSINRIIINSHAQSNFFKMAGKKERLRRYN